MKVLITLVREGTKPTTVTIKELSCSQLMKASRKAGLLSRNADFDFESESDESRGGIYVGMFRRVGTWEII